MATRYADRFEFDHGAQYFTARSDAFRGFLAPLIRDGFVLPWQARYVELSGSTITGQARWGTAEPRYVGAPRMNAIGKALASGIEVRYETRIRRLERETGGWALELVDTSDTTRRASADWVFVCVPLPQATALLAGEAAFLRAVGERKMLGCHALMLGFDASPDLPFDAASVRDADVSWIAQNNSKPGRGASATIVAHASNAWSEANMELDAAAVLEHLVAEVSRVSGCPAGAAVHQAVHRWRYANAAEHASATHWLDPAARLGVAGDWWIRGRVELAFESAWSLAEAYREALR